MKQELPKLPYAYNALEPYIDEATMKVHHDKHHQTYVDKFNDVIHKPEGEKFHNMKVDEVLKNIDKIPESIRTSVRNQGGGTYNHALFWPMLKKDVKPAGKILEAINKEFGSFDEFKKRFTESATGLFGSGWTWLVVNKDKKLEIMNLPNQDSPLSQGKIPIMTVDMWEHAMYLKYQNRKAEYLEAFWHVVNWDFINKLYEDALKGKNFVM